MFILTEKKTTQKKPLSDEFNRVNKNTYVIWIAHHKKTVLQGKKCKNEPEN